MQEDALSESSPRRSVHSHDPLSPKHSSGADDANHAFGDSTVAGHKPVPGTAVSEAPGTLDVTSDPQQDNLAGTGVSTTSSSAPSTIPTPSLASTRSSANRITPMSFEAADTSKEVGAGSSGSMPAVSAPASAAVAAPSPLPVAGERADGSVPASALVASAVHHQDARAEDKKNKAAATLPKIRTESVPSSPQTPREVTAREMLKVESCQLNTSSTVPPQRDNSVGNVVATPGRSALPSPSAATPGAVPEVPELRGVGQHYADGYANAPMPPKSAPNFVNGRRVAPVPQEAATSRLAAGVMSGLPPPMRCVHTFIEVQ